MDMKKLLANLKGASLYALLPVMLVACDSKESNVDAELADVNAKIETLGTRIDSTNVKIERNVADSLAKNPTLKSMGEDIARHNKEYNKLTAPRDSVRRKKFSKKLCALRIDSILYSSNVKETLTKEQKAEYRELFNEYKALVAKRDSLMKKKTR